MQFSVAALVALASTASAYYATSNTTVAAPVVYTTEVHTAYTTYCPEATVLTYGGATYSVTGPTTLTLSSGPYTVVKPIYTTSVVSAAPTYPAYVNATKPVTPPVKTATPSPIQASNGNRAFMLSGASLAGLLGLAAYVL